MSAQRELRSHHILDGKDALLSDYPRTARGEASAGPSSMPPLPCDSCAGRSLNLCEPLDNVGLRQLLSLGIMRRWKRNEILFRAGDTASSFFKIRDGMVGASHTLDYGRRQIVAVRSTGDCVGYLGSAGRYAFTGQALTDVEACAFDRRGFDSLVARNPRLAAALSRALSQALMQSAQAILVIGKLQSTERLAHFLSEMALVHRRYQAIGSPIRLNLTGIEIADYLGLTFETVSRSFGKLKKRSVVQVVGKNGIIVLNDALLREIGKCEGGEWESAVGY